MPPGVLARWGCGLVGVDALSSVSLNQVDRWRSAAAWLVGFAPVIYLALSGGGYDIIVRSELGLVACWGVLLGVLVGMVPRAGLTRASWTALALLGAFLAWTWIASRFNGNLYNRPHQYEPENASATVRSSAIGVRSS